MSPLELYQRVREREGRLYPDAVAARLPWIQAGHPLAGEWRARAASAERLLAHLARRRGPQVMVDLACGNGWLSAGLARQPGARVWGVDAAGPELRQAQRLHARENLAFVEGDAFHLPCAAGALDVIVLASAIQYFADLPGLVRSLLARLKPGGELHVLDSPLYSAETVAAARARTRAYYTELGLPEMAAHYQHHLAAELQVFRPHWLYRPDSWRARWARRLGGQARPFPWVCMPAESGAS